MKDRDLKLVQKNKQDAVNKLNNYLEQLISSDNDEKIKKADLVSYWLRDYARYLNGEETFIPSKQENYKRGDIVKVNLGFNVGNEEGGLHYAIVVNTPAKSSGVVTIIPLTSKKLNSKYNSLTINLGYTVIDSIIKKLNELKECLSQMYESLTCLKDSKLKQAKRKEIEKTMNELNKYTNEANKLKTRESVALVGNIMTISKQRIYTPTINNKFLKGVAISDEQLDMLDKKIIELYTKKKKV